MVIDAIAACGFIQATEEMLRGHPEGAARVIEGVITAAGWQQGCGLGSALRESFTGGLHQVPGQGLAFAKAHLGVGVAVPEALGLLAAVVGQLQAQPLDQLAVDGTMERRIVVDLAAEDRPEPIGHR